MADSHHTSDEHGEHGHDDHGSMKKYLTIFIALCVLTTMSFMTYFEFWRTSFPVQAGWALMMAVSVAKASLVMLFFMHLKYEANWKYVLTIPATIMAVFLTLALIPDVGRRYAEILGGRRPALQQEEFLPKPAAETAALEEGLTTAEEH